MLATGGYVAEIKLHNFLCADIHKSCFNECIVNKELCLYSCFRNVESVFNDSADSYICIRPVEWECLDLEDADIMVGNSEINRGRGPGISKRVLGKCLHAVRSRRKTG